MSLERQIDFDRVLLFEDHSGTRDKFDLVFAENMRHFLVDFTLDDFLKNKNGLLQNALVVCDMNLAYDLDRSRENRVNLEDMKEWVQDLNVEFPCKQKEKNNSYCCEHPSSQLSCGIYRSLLKRNFPVGSHFIFITASDSDNDLKMLKMNPAGFILKDISFMRRIGLVNEGFKAPPYKFSDACELSNQAA